MTNKGFGIQADTIVLLGALGVGALLLWKSGVFKATNALGDVAGDVANVVKPLSDAIASDVSLLDIPADVGAVAGFVSDNVIEPIGDFVSNTSDDVGNFVDNTDWGSVVAHAVAPLPMALIDSIDTPVAVATPDMSGNVFADVGNYLTQQNGWDVLGTQDVLDSVGSAIVDTASNAWNIVTSWF
jgi:hypothetical protein